jgi:hypothetical protein
VVDMFSDNPDYDSSLHIADDSPAAQALAANANVRVSQLGKAARAVHMQSVRKIVKRAVGANKSGVARGKPPRLPPEVEGCVAQDFPSTELVPIDESVEVHVSSQAPDHNHHAAPADESEQTEAQITNGVVAGTAEAEKTDGVVAGTAEAEKRGKTGILTRYRISIA